MSEFIQKISAEPDKYSTICYSSAIYIAVVTVLIILLFLVDALKSYPMTVVGVVGGLAAVGLAAAGMYIKWNSAPLSVVSNIFNSQPQQQ